MFGTIRKWIGSLLPETPRVKALKAIEMLGIGGDRDVEVVFDIGRGNPASGSGVIPDQSFINEDDLEKKLVGMRDKGLSKEQSEAVDTALSYINRNRTERVEVLQSHGDFRGASMLSESFQDSLARQGRKSDHMSLSDYYRGTVEKDGVTYNTVDTNQLTALFQDLEAQVEFGKKTTLTRAYIAKSGEEIVTKHGSGEENRYTAVGGEVVFDNGGGDKFVPRDGDGKSNGAQLLKDKYELQEGSLESGDAKYIPASKASKILIGVNPEPIRILNPWGEGSTQDLPAGSTLKLDGNKVTGIEKAAFEKTWSRTDEAGNILRPDLSAAKEGDTASRENQPPEAKRAQG